MLVGWVTRKKCGLQVQSFDELCNFNEHQRARGMIPKLSRKTVCLYCALIGLIKARIVHSTEYNEIKLSYDPRSYELNFCNCVEKPEKFRSSTGFEPVTSLYRCDALTNWAMKPLTLGAGHLWVVMFPWAMNQRVHNCEDHSFTWFNIRSSIYDSFQSYIISS